MERPVGHLRPMWAWGLAERAVAGMHGGRWNTAVAVGVTAAAGIALVAIVVSSRRFSTPDLTQPSPSCEKVLRPLSCVRAFWMQGWDQIAVAATEKEARACVQGMAQLVHAGGEVLRRRREASEESSERSKI